jgi:hypothetical protein
MCEEALKIANDYRTPRDILADLAKSNNDSVRFAVAYNEATPKAILWHLSRDPYACHAVAANESTPLRCLAKLAEHESESVRLKIARNPSTPARALRKLANNNNSRIRTAVAAHTSTPPQVIADLARSGDASIRWHAAVNDSIPPESVLDLVDDPDQGIRALALERAVNLLAENLKVINSRHAEKRRSVASRQSLT